MQSKVFTKEEVLAKFHDGQTIMFSDLHGEIAAEEIITGMIEKNVKNLTAIAVASGQPDMGVGRLVANHQIKKFLTSHIGLNPLSRDQMFAGEMEVEFIPQGTFAERIRAGGYGLGGVLTPTGVGTDVAKGKQIMNLNGKDYLLEMPIRADIALLKATKADKAGNLQFRLTSLACQDYMAMAADLVIVEVEELVEIGELGPDEIDVPAPIVDMIYVKQGEKRPMYNSWKRQIAKIQAASEKGGK
ncbi:MAG TPA: CoA transferase subunit A [Oscillospiraceae bacterium]|nr:CoA transferase subunit A [Oscillospiraceae bacterium]HPS75611.1 CoA transferase subunit A [Oscillospiraceae bacterium]